MLVGSQVSTASLPGQDSFRVWTYSWWVVCVVFVCIKIDASNSHSEFILPPLCHPPFSPSCHLLTLSSPGGRCCPPPPSSTLNPLQHVDCHLLSAFLMSHVSTSQDALHMSRDNDKRRDGPHMQHEAQRSQGSCHKAVIFTGTVGKN